MNVSEAMLDQVPPHVSGDRVVAFDMYAPPGGDADAYVPWLELRRSTSSNVVWSNRNGGHWIVLKGSYIHELVADVDRLSSRLLPGSRELGEATQLIPLQTDPPEHTLYRSNVSKEMGPDYLTALKDPIREITKTLIAGFRDRGHCDFIAEFAEILPVHVFLIMVGLPREDAAMLRKLALQLVRPDGTMTPEEFMGALDAYLNPYVEARLKNPGSDMLSRVLARPVGDRPWTLDEAKRFCRNILLAGLDTVVALLGYVAQFLAQNPEYQAQLRGKRELIVKSIPELTRRFPVVVLGREARQDFEIDGVLIKKNDIVILPTMLHNLDPEVFEDPLEVRLDRPSKPHTTFGKGIHFCVGAGLARVELITFLELWLEMVPEFRIDPDVEVKHHPGTIITLTNLPLVWDPAALPA